MILQGLKFLVARTSGAALDLAVLNILTWLAGIFSGFFYRSPDFLGYRFLVF